MDQEEKIRNNFTSSKLGNNVREKSRKLSDEEILNRNYYRGRFASPRNESFKGKRMIFNWEETPLS